MDRRLRRALLLVVGLFAGCDTGSVYTLYRTSVFDAKARVYVATFGNGESDAYNQENCNAAMELFNAQKGIVTRFWCEKGEFRK
jgi:hypothetical protein